MIAIIRFDNGSETVITGLKSKGESRDALLLAVSDLYKMYTTMTSKIPVKIWMGENVTIASEPIWTAGQEIF